MKPPFRLPTLAAFKKLSIRKRTQLLLNWARTKRGRYSAWEADHCALYQFGKALAPGLYVQGWTTYLDIGREAFAVINDEGHAICPDDDDHPTFASLVKRLEAHLKETA